MCGVQLQWANSNTRNRFGIKDWRAVKRGDPIVVVPDGWTWGSMEVKHEFFRFVEMPGVHELLFADWLQPAYNWRTGQFYMQRVYFVNVDADNEDGRWIRNLLTLPQVIRLTEAESKRFMSLKAIRPMPIPEIVEAWQQ